MHERPGRAPRRLRALPLASLAFLLLLALPARAPAQDPAPGAAAPDSASYRIYTGTGEPATLSDLLAAMEHADVVFVGEEHDDDAAHAFEGALLQAALRRYGSERPVALSLEMFSRDVQYIVDEYLAGLITEEHLLASASPWRNYGTAYRPLVEFARQEGIPVLAANAPRRYVNRVARLGPASLAALGSRARASLPPLPYPGPSEAYAARFLRQMHAPEGASPHADTTRGEATRADTTQAGTARSDTTPPDTARTGTMHTAPAAHGHGGGLENLLAAQALWDATMAYTIAEHLEAHPGALVVHVVGRFHVLGGTGTPEVLEAYHPGAKRLVVVVQPGAPPEPFEAAMEGTGDFVVVTAR